MQAVDREKHGWAFGGTVTSMFNNIAKVQIEDCELAAFKGSVLTVDYTDIAEQSFRTFVKSGDWVEGRLFRQDDPVQPYRLRYVTKIM